MHLYEKNICSEYPLSNTLQLIHQTKFYAITELFIIICRKLFLSGFMMNPSKIHFNFSKYCQFWVKMFDISFGKRLKSYQTQCLVEIWANWCIAYAWNRFHFKNMQTRTQTNILSITSTRFKQEEVYFYLSKVCVNNFVERVWQWH